MDFITADQVESKKDKEAIAVIHNSQIFFRHITSILAHKLNKKTKDKYSVFFEHFVRHIKTDNKVKFIALNDRHIISMPEAKLVYYPNDLSKPVRIMIQKEEVEKNG